MNYQVLENILNAQKREFTYSDEKGYSFASQDSEEISIQVSCKQYTHVKRLTLTARIALEENSVVPLGVFYDYLDSANQQFAGCLTIDKSGDISYRETTFLPEDTESALVVCRNALVIFEITAKYIQAMMILKLLRAKGITAGLKSELSPGIQEIQPDKHE